MKTHENELTVEKIRQMDQFKDKSDAELERILEFVQTFCDIAYTCYIENQRVNFGKPIKVGMTFPKDRKKAA